MKRTVITLFLVCLTLMVCQDVALKRGVHEGRVQAYDRVCDLYGVPDKGMIEVNGYIMSREGIFKEVKVKRKDLSDPRYTGMCVRCHVRGI